MDSYESYCILSNHLRIYTLPPVRSSQFTTFVASAQQRRPATFQSSPIASASQIVEDLQKLLGLLTGQNGS